MLRYRLLLGALFIAAFAALCWLDQNRVAGAPRGAWLLPLALLLSVPASGEMLWLTTNENRRPAVWLVYVGNFVIVAASGIGLFWSSRSPSSVIGELGWPLAAFMLAVIAAFVVEMYRYQTPGNSIANLSATVLAFAYVGLLFAFVVALPGMVALVSLIAVVKMGDTGAYTVGRLIGRHKMTPRLSPGKTWEGAVGAIMFAILGAWLVFELLAPRLGSSSPQSAGLEAWRWIAYGVIVGIAGLLGDLAESLLKRDAGRKDSSRWMPGFGGVLDVLDSILFAAPVAYLCWVLGLVR